MATGASSCALADVDATHQQGATTAWPAGNLHERVHMAPTTGPLGPEGCATRMAELTQDINDLCCPVGGCQGGLITDCSTECDAIWSPFALECSEWLRQDEILGAHGYEQVTTLCEDEEYGRYTAGNNHGRCSDGDLQQWLGEIAPACCGSNFEHCQFCSDAGGTVDCTGHDMFTAEPTIDGTLAGDTYCARECAPMIEDLYAECHPRLEDMGLAAGMQVFLSTCQGMDGHRRRQLSTNSNAAQELEKFVVASGAKKPVSIVSTDFP
jgi:hypothetical protein